MNNIISESGKILEENKTRQEDKECPGRTNFSPLQVKEEGLFEGNLHSPLEKLLPWPNLPHQAGHGGHSSPLPNSSGPAFLDQATPIPGQS